MARLQLESSFWFGKLFVTMQKLSLSSVGVMSSRCRAFVKHGTFSARFIYCQSHSMYIQCIVRFFWAAMLGTINCHYTLISSSYVNRNRKREKFLHTVLWSRFVPCYVIEHCQCRKGGIPGLQSLIKDLIAYYDDNENSSTDHENAQLMLFGECMSLTLMLGSWFNSWLFSEQSVGQKNMNILTGWPFKEVFK